MQEFEPLEILASLFLIFIVFLINRWLGGYTPARLGDERDALSRLRQDFPSFETKATLVGSDGKSAMLRGVCGGDRDSIALVEAVGDRFLTRILRPGDIGALFLEPATKDTGQKLRLQLRDFTNSAFEIALPAGTNGSQWHKRLSRFHTRPIVADAPAGSSPGPEDSSSDAEGGSHE